VERGDVGLSSGVCGRIATCIGTYYTHRLITRAIQNRRLGAVDGGRCHPSSARK
jgi:hypothetical protein